MQIIVFAPLEVGQVALRAMEDDYRNRVTNESVSRETKSCLSVATALRNQSWPRKRSGV